MVGVVAEPPAALEDGRVRQRRVACRNQPKRLASGVQVDRLDRQP
jgi:hypothetical protein